MIIIKISWIKKDDDNKNFYMAEKLGMHVLRLNNPEEIDRTIKDLISQEYKMIVVSNEMAGFSEDIIKKYTNNNNIKIIIGSRKK